MFVKYFSAVEKCDLCKSVGDQQKQAHKDYMAHNSRLHAKCAWQCSGGVSEVVTDCQHDKAPHLVPSRIRHTAECALSCGAD